MSTPSPIEQHVLELAADQEVLSAREVRALGIHTSALSRLVRDGHLERIGRGLYRSAQAPPLGSPDLVVVAHRASAAVIGLVSALCHHDLTDEIPRTVDLLIERDTTVPTIDHPPIRTFKTRREVVTFGVQELELDGTTVRMTSPAKTVADCFKFRRRVGLDVALAALRQGLEARSFKPAELMKAAEVDRVAGVVRPYLQALLS